MFVWWQTCEQEHGLGAESNYTGAPFLRAISEQCCRNIFVEFIIDTRYLLDEVMMYDSINAEGSNQHSLEIELELSHAYFNRGNDAVCQVVANYFISGSHTYIQVYDYPSFMVFKN